MDKADGAIVAGEINGLLSNLQEEKKNLRQEINNYIYEKTDRLGYNLPLLVWDYRDDQERVNEVVCKEVESLVSKTQKHMEILVKDIIVDDLHNELEILENKLLDIKNAGFREIVIHQERIDALRTEESMDRQKSMLANFHEILKQLEEISKTGKIPNLQELKISDEASGVAGAVASGIGAQMALDSAGTIASNLAKTAIGKAVVKTAAGKAVSSVIGGAVPYIGPLITLAGLLHTFLGGSANDGVAEQRQAEAENEYQRKKLEAEEQMRQDLQQKCRYMAENIADELVLAMDASVNDIVAAYEKPFHEQIEKAKEMDDGRMNDLIALREILGAYEKIEIELGGK